MLVLTDTDGLGIDLHQFCQGILDELFFNIHTMNSHNQHAKECYDLIINQPIDDQKKLCVIIEDIIRYKK